MCRVTDPHTDPFPLFHDVDDVDDDAGNEDDDDDDDSPAKKTTKTNAKG